MWIFLQPFRYKEKRSIWKPQAAAAFQNLTSQPVPHLQELPRKFFRGKLFYLCEKLDKSWEPGENKSFPMAHASLFNFS
jgi:hypothetical protein